jgi:undecaprenyl phosphate-alpha-L-ara4N flippase subunit ArnE
MSHSAVLLLILSLTCDAAGQICFKRAAVIAGELDLPWHQWWQRLAHVHWIWAGIGCFVLEFFLWLGVLSLLPLSRGVLLGSASTIVMLVAGRLFFGERLGSMQVLGASLIAIGVAVVGLS